MSVAPEGETAFRDAASDSVTFSFGDATARRFGLARLGISRAPDGSGLLGSALVVLFAGQAPVAAVARGGLPVDGASWAALELGPLRTTVNVPLDRKTDRLTDNMLKLDPDNVTSVEWKESKAKGKK